MIEVLRNFPARNRRVPRSWNYPHKRRSPDYMELNRKRPSVIRRSIKSSSKCSSPREAILETNFHYEKNTELGITPITPTHPQSNCGFIPKDPGLSTKDSQCTSPDIPNYPQRDASVIHESPPSSINDPRTIHQNPQQDHQKSPVVQQSRVTFTPSKSTERDFDLPKKDNKVHLDKFLELRKHHEVQITQCLSIDSSAGDKKYDRAEIGAFPISPEDSNVTFQKSVRRSTQTSESERQYKESEFICSGRIWSSIKKIKQDRDNTEETKHSPKEQVSSPVTQPDACSDEERRDSEVPLKTHNTELTTRQGGNTESPKRDQKYKFYCSHCKKRFRWFSHWQAHERTHTGERPFKCTQCDRRFTRGDGLQAHMMTHSTKKPYKCSTCLKVFARKPMLERHILEHTGVVPYKCEVCEVQILDPGEIIGHLALHDKQSKFSCQYCRKCFSSGLRLVKHIRAHTGKLALPTNLALQLVYLQTPTLPSKHDSINLV